jgi:arginyl-tRNA synthetase
MQIREIIKQSIEKGVKGLQGGTLKVGIEHPADEDHGDYSSNVALKTGVKAGELEKELLKDKDLMKVVEKIDIAGPGFVNFWLKKGWLVNEMAEVVKKAGDYGRGFWGKGKRMVIDYSAPNIAKQFSVGHLRSTIIGQAIYNLYKFSGWKCVGDNHLGDWGTQFGMIIAAVEKWDLDLSKMKVDEIEKIYVKYNRLVKEDEKYLEKAQEAFARLEKGERKAKRIWELAVEMSLKDFDRIYNLLGVSIDIANGESFYKDMIPEIVKEMKEKKVAVVGEGGALIVELPDLPPAMLVKSNGSSTYFTRDMATIKHRNETPNLASDLYVYEVGAEQSLPFKQLFLTAEKMGWGKKEKFVHLAHGLVLGNDGKKMSTRKGTTESMESLLNQMIERAASINEQSAKKVGVGAVIFNDLKHSPQTSYKFDWEKALSMEGDSGPYVQYTAVRAKSVLSRSTLGEIEDDFSKVKLSDEELKVLRKLYRFEEVVERATKEFSPNLLCEYLLELSRSFNGFYGNNQVIGSKNEEFRLSLTTAVAQVLENGLKLLNVEVPEEM